MGINYQYTPPWNEKMMIKAALPDSWSTLLDSNQGPPRYKLGALTN